MCPGEGDDEVKFDQPRLKFIVTIAAAGKNDWLLYDKSNEQHHKTQQLRGWEKVIIGK